MGKRELLKDNKELMKEYDYEKNKDINLETQKSGSAKKIWWICEKGHSWDARINDRARGIGCPICSNHRVLEGYNDLKTKKPKIAKEWDYRKNEMKPSEVTWTLNKKVWWICPKKHEYEATIVSRTVNNTGCPYCSGNKILRGYNDLESQYPNLMKEWDYNKNIIEPYEIGCGTQKKVWWICKNGHSFNTSIVSRVNGSGCPYCSGNQILKGYNDLESQYPNIAKEWDYNKNIIKPSEITTGTNKKFWFVCSKGHSYMSRIVSKTSGSGCPYCANKKVLKGFNDFATLHPELLEEWDYDKNKLKPSEVISGSKVNVWWKCRKGHSWCAPLKERTGSNSHGCPRCNMEKHVSIPEKVVFYYINKYFKNSLENYSPKWLNKKNFDIYIPSRKIAIEYDGGFFHKDIKKDKTKDKLAKDNNVVLYRIREKSCPILDSTSICLILENNSNEELERIIINLLRKLGIKKYEINIQKDLLEIYKLVEVSEKKNSILKADSIITKEWNYEKNEGINPDYITIGSSKKFWWKCSICGHEWMATPQERKRGRGCPMCAGRKLFSGINDFASFHPDLLKEWDYEKNKNVDPHEIKSGSLLKVWWKCKNGHSWVASIKGRSNGNKCPYCSGRIITKGVNDLKTLCPELMKEWDYEKNNEIDPSSLAKYSNKVVWWKCRNGHEWERMISARTSSDSSCPYCTNQKLLKGYNDLQTINPKLAEEWNYEKNSNINPEKVFPNTNKKVWWKCKKCGHEWKALISSRNGGSGCPKCAKSRW